MAASLALFASSLPLSGSWFVDAGLLYALLLVLSATVAWLRRPGFNFKGKHVLVTGGSSGLGKAFAVLCAQRGAATVTIVARNKAKLEVARTDIQASCVDSRSQKIVTVAADVTKFEEVQAAVAASEKIHHGPVDLLVCNAGAALPGLFLEQPVGVFREQMDLNYFGTLHTVKAALPAMAEARSGVVVIVSSALALFNFVGYTQYGSTKFALRGLAEAMRNEFLRYRIRVVHFMPSNIDTPGYENENKAKPEETRLIEGTATTSKPEDTARRLAAAIASGGFHHTEEAITYLLQVLCSGMAPRSNALLEFLLLPLCFVFGLAFRLYMDFVVSSHRPKASGAASKKSD